MGAIIAECQMADRANSHGVHVFPCALAAIVERESGGNAHALSFDGGWGLASTERKVCKPGKHGTIDGPTGNRRCLTCDMLIPPDHVYEDGICIVCGHTNPRDGETLAP